MSKYHTWQGEKIRKLLAFVVSEDFNLEIESIQSSLREELIHIIAAIKTCLARIDDDLANLENEFDKLRRMSKEDLMKQWELVEEQFQNKIDGMDELNNNISIANITEKPYEISKKDYFTHYVLHSNYHRAHIMWILRTLDYRTATLDYILYFNDTAFYSE